MTATPKKHYTVTDLAKALGAGRSATDYKIWKQQIIPPPSHTIGVGRRRYYTEDEFKAIVEMMREAEVKKPT